MLLCIPRRERATRSYQLYSNQDNWWIGLPLCLKYQRRMDEKYPLNVMKLRIDDGFKFTTY